MLSNHVLLVAAASESVEWNTHAVAANRRNALHSGIGFRAILTVTFGNKYVFYYTEI